jgi:hypothetical protein
MTFWPENPGLDELLSDPVVLLAMRADGVEPHAVKSLMKGVGRRLAARRAGFLLPSPTAVRLGGDGAVAPSLLGTTNGRSAPCGMAPCW